MQTKCYASVDFSFSVQMLFLYAKCSYDAHVSFQRYNFHDADVPCDGANATFIHDGASARIYPWCKCLLTEMEMQNVLWCKCLLMGMSWCTCPFGYAMMRMSSCRYVMMQMLWCRHNSFKNSLYFQTRLPQRLKPKYFQNLIYYSWKVISLLT